MRLLHLLSSSTCSNYPWLLHLILLEDVLLLLVAVGTLGVKEGLERFIGLLRVESFACWVHAAVGSHSHLGLLS